MLQLDFISARGGILPLVNNENFALTGCDGMTQTYISLSASSVPSMDGDYINNAQAQYRPIVLYLEPRADKNVEEVKRLILSYVKPKIKGTLHCVLNKRDIIITGIVERIEMPRFTDNCVMQISMYCSQPYWEDIEEIVTKIKLIKDLHYFPIEDGGIAFPAEGIPFGVYDTSRIVTYTNTGDVAVGVTITIIALDTVTNPIIYNLVTGEYIGIIDTLQANDEVIISTHKGSKTITKNGRNIIDLIKDGSTFLQIEVGDNEFKIDSDDDEVSDNMYFTLNFKQRYV